MTNYTPSAHKSADTDDSTESNNHTDTAATDGGIIVAGDDAEIIDADVDEDVQDDEDDDSPLSGSCVGGYEWCPGVDGMYFGQFPCATCWMLSPGSAHRYFAEWEGDL